MLALIDERPRLTSGLPQGYTWQANAAATLGAYQALTARRTAR